jgi:N-acetylglucosaminyl-diphospho-decaprenol L-rhamnosyltransferase
VSGLSIVIPTYNTASMTLATCRALWGAGALAGGEIIIVDDASTDDTVELLSTEPVTVIRLEQNRRFAGAANAGVAASQGSIVLLLNSDARPEPGAIDALLRAFDSDPRLGVAGARLLNSDSTPQWSGGPVPTLAWLVVMVSGIARFLPRRRGGPHRSVAWVSGAAMAFRREVWAVAGPLNESYRFYAQDLELCVRARAAGWDVRVIEDARVIHEGGATMPRDAAMLRSDLLTWGRAHYGRAWAAVARPLTSVAAAVRRVISSS